MAARHHLSLRGDDLSLVDGSVARDITRFPRQPPAARRHLSVRALVGDHGGHGNGLDPGTHMVP